MRQDFMKERARLKNRFERALVLGGFNVSQLVTDVFGKTGLVIVSELLAEDCPKDIIKSIECELDWRLKTPRQKLLDALSGTMSETLKFWLKMDMDILAGLDAYITELDDKLERGFV